MTIEETRVEEVLSQDFIFLKFRELRMTFVCLYIGTRVLCKFAEFCKLTTHKGIKSSLLRNKNLIKI